MIQNEEQKEFRKRNWKDLGRETERIQDEKQEGFGMRAGVVWDEEQERFRMRNIRNLG